MLKYCNLPREACHHLIGRDHTAAHRMAAGAVIALLGVAIAKSPDLFDFHSGLFHYVADLVGYGVHGLGLTPFIEHALD